jgi:hypothetical protein
MGAGTTVPAGGGLVLPAIVGRARLCQDLMRAECRPSFEGLMSVGVSRVIRAQFERLSRPAGMG